MRKLTLTEQEYDALVRVCRDLQPHEDFDQHWEAYFPEATIVTVKALYAYKLVDLPRI